MNLLSQTKYKLSLIIIGVLSIFAMSFMPNTKWGADAFVYSSEKEIEETEEEKEKSEYSQYKVGTILAKGKNIPLYEIQKIVKIQMSVILNGIFDIFFAKEIVKTKIATILAPISASVSPLYLLFHRLIFYC